ncbi:rRNA maturation RNase YbeY [Polymorphum gilvum]|uniref:Endoribonuclease YbeY n=1 Tax=Polymorphum gilvum (strain LMG 25793 / CGMCC 1.9160 / SL003B-26A1) TaxID=991905 RepID=F2IVL1_POLGS|nr:rRNA maturation RNase YbeY [Polymorphum gilvum]ADZ72729.1 Putative metalloprotease [Polymorphum gilvum SL003B-26A1]
MIGISATPVGALPEDLQIDLAVEAGDWPDGARLEDLTRAAVAAAFRNAPLRTLPGSELSLVFLDDDGIRALNRSWRNKDKPTNVLSFSGGDAVGGRYGPMLGDIVLSSDTLAREAKEQGISFCDHFSHLVVHGLLHLFGYDHQIEAEAEIMEGLERRILADLGIADPYAGDPLTADKD